MESHIQSWFAINPESKEKHNLLTVYEDKSKIDFDNFNLGKSEVLTKVKRVGKNSKATQSTWYHLSVDEPIRKKIREWIATEKTFEPEKVTIENEEVLVKVIKECCSATSSGER